MATPRPSHLKALREGLNLLGRHPRPLLALAILSMALGQLGPALELAAGVDHQPLLSPLFGFVAVLPLEMYFLPRFLSQLDAEAQDPLGRASADWASRFDTRWMPSFLARMALTLAVGLGALLLLVPGLLVLTFFGWAPLRMLLRGDAFPAALRWSQAAMARHWPRVVQAVLAVALVLLTYAAASNWVLEHWLRGLAPEASPGALLRLRHPAFWVLGFTTGLCTLWMNTTLLALYHRLETAVAGAQSSSK